jgi:hypothetical protein
METLVRGTSGERAVDGSVATGSGGGGSGGILATGSGGFVASTGGAGGTGGSSGPCGEATCLTSLFQTCVPAGSCSAQGGGGPHTSVSTACYANGVTVSWINGWDGVASVRGSLTVRLNGSDCYAVEWVEGSASTSYVVKDASGNQVAAGIRDPGATTATVTCDNGRSTSVSLACLTSVGVDLSTCDSEPCS